MAIELMNDTPNTHLNEVQKYEELYFKDRTISGAVNFISSTSGINYSTTDGGEEGVFQNLLNELKTVKRCLLDKDYINPSIYLYNNLPKLEPIENFWVMPANEQVNVYWTNPSDREYLDTEGIAIKAVEFDRIKLYRDGNLVYEGDFQSYIDTGLTNYQEYTYSIISISKANIESDPIFTTVTPTPFTMDLQYNVSNFVAKGRNTMVELSWTNPVGVDFEGVLIRASNTSYPTSIIDGELVYDGIGESYTETGLTNEVPRYYTVWAYNDANQYSVVAINETATPAPFVVYGIKIDTTNSNPETALVYTDDAVGFTPAQGNNGSFLYGSWEDKFPFNQIKPCLYLNGAVNYYLDPNDYTKKADGVTESDITSGADGDVMVEFPKIWWKFETAGTDLYVKYSDTQFDADYKCLAHTKGVIEKDFVYISAYLGHTLSSKLRSLSGKTPTESKTIGAFRTETQANGAEFEQMAYYQLLMTQVLYLVMFKSRDSQTALGRGFVDGNTAAIATGGANLKGMFYGETTGKQQLKFCGIEDWYGNLRYWIDGFFSNASRNMLIGTENFNDTGSGYTNYGQGATTDIGGYISAIQGGTETGFVVKASVGSSTTHYADSGSLYASRLPYFGGSWTDADYAGAFYLYVYYSDSDASATIGARSLAL